MIRTINIWLGNASESEFPISPTISVTLSITVFRWICSKAMARLDRGQTARR